MGPIGAMGIAVAMLSMLTFLPAMLAIFGRRAFWRPAIFGWDNGIPRLGATGADETHGVWRRVGERVAPLAAADLDHDHRDPDRLLLGVLNFSTGLNGGNSYVGEVESVEGQELLAKAFPQGDAIPTDIVVPDASRAEAVAAAVGDVDRVSAVRPARAGRRRACCSRPCSTSTRTPRRPRRRSTRSARPRARRAATTSLVGGADGDPARPPRGRDARHAADRPDRAGRSCS